MKVLVSPQDKVYLTSGNRALKAKEKCGMTIGGFIGNIDTNNTLQKPANEIIADFSGVEDLGNYALQYKFAGNSNVSSVSFPDLTSISGQYALYYSFRENTNITRVDFPELLTVTGSNCFNFAFQSARLPSIVFPKLTTINGVACFSYAFSSNTALQSVEFPELTTISGNGVFSTAFQSDSSLTTVLFPKLTSITGYSVFSSAFTSTSIANIEFPELTSISAPYGSPVFANSFQNLSTLKTARFTKLSQIEMTGSSTSGGSFTSCFNSCSSITDIYFNALTTSSFVGSLYQFNAMFNSTTASASGSFTMHFPSNLSSTISGLTGYPNFGATAGRLVLAFDLPATS